MIWILTTITILMLAWVVRWYFRTPQDVFAGIEFLLNAGGAAIVILLAWVVYLVARLAVAG